MLYIVKFSWWFGVKADLEQEIIETLIVILWFIRWELRPYVLIFFTVNYTLNFKDVFVNALLLLQLPVEFTLTI